MNHAQEAPLEASASEEDAKKAAAIRFEAAVKLVETGRYQEAAVELERSIALYPTKAAIFNLGNSYQALHRYVDALRQFEKLEREYGDQLSPELRASLDTHLAEVKGLVARLDIQVTPEGARISINGAEIATGPGPTLLEPGTFLVRAEKSGYTPKEQRVTLGPGASSRVRLELTPALADVLLGIDVAGATVWIDGKNRGSSPLAGPISLTAGTHELKVERAGFLEEKRQLRIRPGERLTLEIKLRRLGAEPSAAPEASSSSLPTGFWISAGATVLFTGASAVTFALAASRDSELEEQVGRYQALPANTAQVTLNREYEKLEDTQSERNTLAAVGWTTAGLATVGLGVTLVLGYEALFGSSNAREDEPHALWVTPSGIAGRF